MRRTAAGKASKASGWLAGWNGVEWIGGWIMEARMGWDGMVDVGLTATFQ